VIDKKTVKQEALKLALLFISLAVITKLVLYNESILVVLRLIASMYWIFIIPGFLIMYHWKDHLDFVQRLLIGFAFSAAVIGISSYYLGLAGIHIKYHFMILPTAVIIFGIIGMVRK
jgi:uncharacterized membrane protein